MIYNVEDKLYTPTKSSNDMETVSEKQYLMLREAVWKRMDAQRRMSTFTITAILAFYTIVFSAPIYQPYVFLIPIAFLLPFSNKELQHKIAISYIVAYQIVALENNKNAFKSFTWETDFFLLKKKTYIILQMIHYIHF